MEIKLYCSVAFVTGNSLISYRLSCYLRNYDDGIKGYLSCLVYVTRFWVNIITVLHAVMNKKKYGKESISIYLLLMNLFCRGSNFMSILMGTDVQGCSILF